MASPNQSKNMSVSYSQFGKPINHNLTGTNQSTDLQKQRETEYEETNMFSTTVFRRDLNLYRFYLNVSKKHKRQFQIGLEHIRNAYNELYDIYELEEILTEYEDMYDIYICLIYYILIYNKLFKNQDHAFSTKYKHILYTFGDGLRE